MSKQYEDATPMGDAELESLRAELNQIKQQWQEANSRLEQLEAATVADGERVSTGRVKSAQQRLMDMYKRFAIISLLCVGWMPLMISRWQDVFSYSSTTYRIMVVILCALYFLTASTMDFCLYRGVRAIDIARMPISEVSTRAIRLKRSHHICQLTLIPLAIILLTLMIWPIASSAALIGIATGGVVGLAIGLTAYFRMMRSYRTLIADR